MGDDSPLSRAAYFHGVAERLRGIAGEIRFDWNRKNQILALADGFERFARRLAHVSNTDAERE